MLLDSATATWRQERDSKILWESDFCTQPHYQSDGGQNRHLPVCTDLCSKPVQVLRKLCPCKVKEGAVQESRGRDRASLEGAGEGWGGPAGGTRGGGLVAGSLSPRPQRGLWATCHGWGGGLPQVN